MNYHVGRAGQQLGVFPLEDIRARLASGEFRADDLGWTEGMSDWKPLGEIAPGILPAFTSSTPPPIRADAPPSWTQPAPTNAPRPYGTKPGNNLVAAILVTIFCCLPFGIPAIIYAAQVDSKFNAGDQAGAEESAAKSKKWMWISLAVGLILTMAYLGLMSLGIFSGFLSQSGF